MFDEPDNGSISLYAVNDGPSKKQFTYRVTDLTCGKTVLSGEYTVDPDCSAKIAAISVSDTEKKFYFIEWECNDEKGSNHYMTNIIDIDYSEYISYMEKCGYDEWHGFGENNE